jgi:L-lactate dehydrogenase complex protein LldF
MASTKRSLMNMGNGNLKNKLVNKIFKDWTKNRGDLNFSPKTFNEMWKEKNNKS